MTLLVIVESPFAGDTITHIIYARRALKDSLLRGESPFASHLLYPQVLSDDDPIERILGIHAGFDWGAKANLITFYTDYGWSPGMKKARTHWGNVGIETVERSIGQNNSDR